MVAPAPAPTAAPLPAFAPTGGAFQWTSSLAEAQSLARATGRLILVEEGRPACVNCRVLRDTIIPGLAADLGAVAVGYYDDVDANPNSQSFQILRSNLPDALTLPLVGFLTPDLRWVHGYWGGRDAPRFRAEIATARSRARAMALAPAPTTPAPRVAAGPAPRSAVTLPPPAVSASPAPSATPRVAARTEEKAVCVAARDADPDRAWARDRLDRAVDALAALDYAKARAILAEVAPKAAGLPEEEDVRAGEVAIRSLDRIDRAESRDEADRLRDDARASLAGTCWEPLFP
jgi:hypothetical protein